MSHIVYKYAIEIKDTQQITLPMNSQILCVQIQYGLPYIWVLQDLAYKIHPVTLELIGTGYHIDGSVRRKYIGTFQMQEGRTVFHLFQILD